MALASLSTEATEIPLPRSYRRNLYRNLGRSGIIPKVGTPAFEYMRAVTHWEVEAMLQGAMEKHRGPLVGYLGYYAMLQSLQEPRGYVENRFDDIRQQAVDHLTRQQG